MLMLTLNVLYSELAKKKKIKSVKIILIEILNFLLNKYYFSFRKNPIFRGKV